MNRARTTPKGTTITWEGQTIEPTRLMRLVARFMSYLVRRQVAGLSEDKG